MVSKSKDNQLSAERSNSTLAQLSVESHRTHWRVEANSAERLRLSLPP